MCSLLCRSCEVQWGPALLPDHSTETRQWEERGCHSLSDFLNLGTETT